MENVQKKNEKRWYIPMEVTDKTVFTTEYENAPRKWSKIGNRMVRTILIPATKEQYEAYMRPQWKENKRRQRLAEKRKKRERAQEEHRVDKSVKGWDTPVSYEQLTEMEYGFEADFDLEEMVLKEDLLAALRHELATWKKINRTIVMMLANGFSEADVGKTVGLSQKAVNKRKQRLYALLKEHLKDFR